MIDKILSGYKLQQFLKGCRLYLSIAAVVVIIGLPLFWLAACSVKPPNTLFSKIPTFLTQNPTFEHYAYVMKDTDFLVWFRNSFIVGIGSVALTVSIATLAGYSLTRFKIYKKNLILYSALVTYMVPQMMLGVPFFMIESAYGLANTYLGLILAHTTICLPFTVILLRHFFRTIPIDIEEAALVDGAGRGIIFYKIILPLARPGIIAAATFSFATSWNNYTYSLLLMKSTSKMTLPVGAAIWATRDWIMWGKVIAMGVAIIIPIIVIFSFVQKHLISGLAAGGVKG